MSLAGFLLATAATPLPSPMDGWEPRAGDNLIIDTEHNIGYLRHRDGSYGEFRVATGQRRVVAYIGRVYNATTPVGSWVVKSHHTKADRITFGPTGSFLRMYRDGEDYTSYGIHGHALSAEMLTQDVRFESMGCIIVSEEVIHILEQTFEKNGQRLDVTTLYGPPVFSQEGPHVEQA